jgi:hypothetical protein
METTMYHFEFYVLWKDHRWSLETIELQDDRRAIAQETAIDIARSQLADRLRNDNRGLIAIGPLYLMSEKEQSPVAGG